MSDRVELETKPLPRLATVDGLKGMAIIFVLLIHAKPLEGWWIYDYVINRATAIFFVLFGLTSEYWWRRHATTSYSAATKAWLHGRLDRLLLPFATATVLFWLAVWQWRPDVPLHTAYVTSCFIGVCPWWGTSWFVTAILQLVLLFPLLRLLPILIGDAPALLVTWALNVACMFAVLKIMGFVHGLVGEDWPGGLYYLQIFGPAYFWQVCAGIVLARRGLQETLTPRAVAAAGAFVIVAAAIHAHFIDSWHPLAMAAQRTADPALVIALLGVTGIALTQPRIAHLLVLAGSCSWGLYIGHTLAHEILHLFRFWPEHGPLFNRWAYAFLLLVSGSGLIVIGTLARALVWPEVTVEKNPTS